MNLSDVALLAKEELSLAEKGIASAKVVLTGFVVVFAMLILLIFIIKIYGAIIQKAQDAGKKSKEKKAETVAETPAPVVAAPVAPAQTDGVSDEVVAVISASSCHNVRLFRKSKNQEYKKSSDGRSFRDGQKPVYLILPPVLRQSFKEGMYLMVNFTRSL